MKAVISISSASVNRKRLKTVSVFRCCTLAFILAASGAGRTAEPVNPDASQDVRKVLNYLHMLRDSGKVLAGQQAAEWKSDIYNSNNEYQHAKDVTGDYPALLGVDFIGLDNAMNAVMEHWRNGGLVTASWHQSHPSTAYNSGYGNSTNHMSEDDFQQVITPGNWWYDTWLDHIDRMAENLKSLRDDGVVVLWRPYHEMTGGWFWWGAKGEAFQQLWINMYERYTDHHGLNNLIWVWSAAMVDVDMRPYFPEGYADMGGIDIYNSERFVDEGLHGSLRDAVSGLPVALTETGLLPTVEDFLDKTDHIYFLPWHSGWMDREYYGTPGSNGPGNTPDILREYYSHPSVVSMEDLDWEAVVPVRHLISSRAPRQPRMQIWRGLAVVRYQDRFFDALGKPVSPAAP